MSSQRICYCLLALIAIISSAAAEDKPIELGDRKRLTWDDSLFDKFDGVRFEMHRPHLTRERNLVADKPWESWQMGGMSSFLHDNGKFRLWYGVSHGIRNGEEYAICYAESDDGIQWTKPNLGLVEYNGSKENNLVFPYNSVVGQVFIEADAPSDERYKMLVAIFPPDYPKVKRYLSLLTSPDGLLWTKADKDVVPDGEFALDTQSQAFYDRDRKSYVLFTRMGPWRQVGRSESKNPFAFPPPVNVMRPDDPVKADYYQAGVTKYEHASNAYFGLVPVFFHPGDAQGKPLDDNPPFTVTYGKNPITVVMPDTLDIHLFTSNDSIAWQRRGEHEPFIGLGPDGEFDSRSLYPGVGYAVVGNEIWLYYSAYDCTHIESLDGEKPFEKYLGTITRATMRLDGFVSANAGHGSAELITKPITFTGDRLELNVDCSGGGHLNVELQSADGQPIPGYTLADCDRIYHNNIRKTVTWKGKADVSSLKGKSVRINLAMRDAKLYALQFASSK